MFRITSEKQMNGRALRYVILRNDEPLTYANVLELWQHSKPFVSFFLELLSGSEFSAYRWETPPIIKSTVHRPFEFVLIDAPGIVGTPDQAAFNAYYTDNDSDHGVVAFENLGKDAMLIVPSPRGSSSVYGHLAAFIRGAPEGQRFALWHVVGREVLRRLRDHRPLWVSTAGGGVTWLHVRLDDRPKYYGFSPYRRTGSF